MSSQFRIFVFPLAIPSKIAFKFLYANKIDKIGEDIREELSKYDYLNVEWLNRDQEGLMRLWKPFMCCQAWEEEGGLIWGGNPDDAAAAVAK